MPLFEVAIIEHPTDDEAKEGKLERLVFGPKAIIADNDQNAVIVAVFGEIPFPQFSRDRAEVIVRPFISDPQYS